MSVVHETEREGKRRIHDLRQLAQGTKCRRSSRAARLFLLAVHSQVASNDSLHINVDQTLVMSSEHQGMDDAATTSKQNVFDTESLAVGIDNRASACTSCDQNDFVGPLSESNKAVKTFGGRLMGGIKKGTIRWTVLEDDGERHT